MRRRKKLHIIIPASALAAVALAILYLRAVEYTISARQLLIGEIARATGKKAFCTSVRFDPAKGLVLDRAVIYDDKRVIVRAREISSGLLIPSFVSKRVIVPVVTVDAPRIYAELRPDGTLSLLDLFPKDFVSASGMPVSVHRVAVRGGIVTFVDRISSPEFIRKLSGLDLDVRLYLPVRAVFKASFLIPDSTAVGVSGEYRIPDASVLADVTSGRLSPKDFAHYLRWSGFEFPSGSVDVKAKVRIANGAAASDIKARARKVVAVKDGVRSDIDCDIQADFKYDIARRSADWSGSVDVKRMDVDGLLPEGAGRLENVRGRAVFDRSHLTADGVLADAAGMSWQAKVNVANFSDPIVDIYAGSPVRLGPLAETLRKRFGVKLPTEAAGKGYLKLSVQMASGKDARFGGSVSVSGATASLGAGNFPLERITGEFRFGPDRVEWRGVRAACRGTEYRTSGRLTDFASPRVRLEASSENLSWKADLALRGNAVSVYGLEGRYLNSVFSASGEISLEDPSAVDADLKGALTADLADLRGMSQGPAGVRRMKPSGKLAADFELSGDVKNMKACYAAAKVRSDMVSAYGVKMTDLTFSYVQEQGVGSVKSLRSSLYGGALSASARIDWLAKGLPFSVTIDAIGVRMERLKEDTGFRDRDVSGDIKVYADLKGLFKDSSKLSGIGHMGISKGRLWQLDLFKGAGSLIFSRDFSDVVFTEGACDWKMSGKAFLIENLVMKSDILTLRGSGSIGPDRAVEGVIRPEISEDATTGGRFAAAVGKGTEIEISGTLKDPRFKTRTSVIDVVGAMLQRQ